MSPESSNFWECFKLSAGNTHKLKVKEVRVQSWNTASHVEILDFYEDFWG